MLKSLRSQMMMQCTMPYKARRAQLKFVWFDYRGGWKVANPMACTMLTFHGTNHVSIFIHHHYAAAIKWEKCATTNVQYSIRDGVCVCVSVCLEDTSNASPFAKHKPQWLLSACSIRTRASPFFRLVCSPFQQWPRVNNFYRINYDFNSD